MSLGHGAPINKITRDGLILNLDFSNPASYFGEGSIIYDTSTNKNTATIYNGPVFDTTKKCLTFDGTNDYIFVNEVSNFRSFVMWAYFIDPNTAWHYILDARPGYGSGYFAHTTSWTGGWSNIYVNGVSTGMANIPLNTLICLYAEAPTNYTSTMTLFSRYSYNECMGGDLYSFQMYNKILTPLEITQNFESKRSRYGI